MNVLTEVAELYVYVKSTITGKAQTLENADIDLFQTSGERCPYKSNCNHLENERKESIKQKKDRTHINIILIFM